MPEFTNFSTLIGGKAGFGIDKSGSIIAKILALTGYYIYMYRDYPSLIRGGHTFSIIRASNKKIGAHEDQVDFLLALNQDTLNKHKDKLKQNGVIIFDSDSVKIENIRNDIKAVAISIGKILKEENASDIMRNTCIIGSFCKAAGIEFELLKKILSDEMKKELDINIKIAKRGFDSALEMINIKLEEGFVKSGKIFTGNEALSLGLIKAGLKTFIAYPMTPSSTILHYMAGLADDFNIKVIHPESEIAVMLMALGFSYMGEKVAVGTSGGGFCLMTEGLSFSGMAELPVVIVMGQRTGPSTGLPTYSGQSELHFVINAGQGEFPRFITAPSDAEDAYYWSQAALNLAWKFQIPSFILTDKTLAEGAYSFDINSISEIDEQGIELWERAGQYKRYLDNETGVSPLNFPPDKGSVIKANSYEHDEAGITTEDPVITKKMQEKRLRKGKYLIEELEKYKCVEVFGNKESKTALVCWGSNKGVCVEAGESLGLKIIHISVLWPFPKKQFEDAIKDVSKLINVENNQNGQLAQLLNLYGFKVDDSILKYDGRPFTLDELLTAYGLRHTANIQQ